MYLVPSIALTPDRHSKYVMNENYSNLHNFKAFCPVTTVWK